jgi:hypothetical protein
MSDMQYDLFGNPVTSSKAGPPAGAPPNTPVQAAPSPISPAPEGAIGDVRTGVGATSAPTPPASVPAPANPGAGAPGAGPAPTGPASSKATWGRPTPATPPVPTPAELAQGRALVSLTEAMVEAARTKLELRAGLLPVPSPRIDAAVLAAAARMSIEQPALVAQLRLILPRRNGAGEDVTAATDEAPLADAAVDADAPLDREAGASASSRDDA